MSATVVRGRDVPAIEQSWGSLQWLVGGERGKACDMTFGRVTFEPGEANPGHHHPNCDEILFVVSGRIEHALPESGTVELGPGDCIVLPKGGQHSARNVGEGEAVVVVAFNSADRQTVGE